MSMNQVTRKELILLLEVILQLSLKTKRTLKPLSANNNKMIKIAARRDGKHLKNNQKIVSPHLQAQPQLIQHLAQVVYHLVFKNQMTSPRTLSLVGNQPISQEINKAPRKKLTKIIQNLPIIACKLSIQTLNNKRPLKLL